MSRQKRHIEKLTGEQKSSLEKGYRTGKSHLYRRKCQSILLSNEGKDVQTISDLFGVGPRTVYTWFNLWESAGIQGLELKPGRGRKPKLKLANEDQVKRVKTLIENEPKNLNRIVGQIKLQLGIDLRICLKIKNQESSKRFNKI